MEPEKTIAQIKGLEIDRAKRIDATKIPMFMLSAYITPSFDFIVVFTSPEAGSMEIGAPFS